MKMNKDTGSRSIPKELVLVFCIILFAGLIRVPSLTQPLGPDQGIMSVIGEGIINGGLPYRDYWEMGSPAIFFTYALMFKVFGLSMAAIPITDTLVAMLTTFLIFLLAKSILNRNVGYFSALFFAFFSNGVRLGMHAGGDVAFGTFWYIAQRETFILPLTVASIYFLLNSEKEDKRWWELILSGFLSGLAFVYKFPSLFIFISLVLYLNGSSFINKDKRVRKKLLNKNLGLISGFLLALIPFALIFVIRGAMQEMVDVIFKYVFSVYGQIEHNYITLLKMGLTRTLFVAKENFILWIFAFASTIYLIRNDRDIKKLLVVLWGGASLLFLVSHREFFGYHYLIVLPPFSILAGYGIAKALGPVFNIRKVFSAEFGKVFIIFAIVANLVIFAALNFTHYTKAYYYISGKISQKEYYDFFSAYPNHEYSFPSDYEVARFIKENSDLNDFIYVLGGTESVIYFLSERKSASRFIFSWFLFSPTHGQVKKAKSYREELLSDLKTRSPKYIVTIQPLETFKQFPRIYAFIRNNYVLEKEFADDRIIYAFRKF